MTRLAYGRSPVRVRARVMFSRFPRPNPVARRVFQFHDGVGVEFHDPFWLRVFEGICSFLSREKDATLFTFDISLHAIPFR